MALCWENVPYFMRWVGAVPPKLWVGSVTTAKLSFVCMCLHVFNTLCSLYNGSWTSWGKEQILYVLEIALKSTGFHPGWMVCYYLFTLCLSLLLLDLLHIFPPKIDGLLSHSFYKYLHLKSDFFLHHESCLMSSTEAGYVQRVFYQRFILFHTSVPSILYVDVGSFHWEYE